MTMLTVAAKKNHVEVTDLCLAEAAELFGAANVTEQWGVVHITCSVAKVRRTLRDAGHRTTLTK